jgi:saccharopine dehydrogenase (NAD+, L-lysine forming)
MKIGIIREGKVPVDHRVPLSPAQARETMEKFPHVQVVVQSSKVRSFTDDDYRKEGIRVVDTVDDCDVLMGVKEVPKHELIPGKTYFFFSHTIKKQAYNRDLLRTILDKRIRMIDWETLTNSEGTRIIAFGRWAGIVGAYNALWTYGKRYNLFHLRRAHECFDLEDLKTEFAKIKLPKIRIALTGGGRVGKGAIETLNAIGIRKVAPEVFLNEWFEEPVYTQLNTHDYNRRKDGGDFSRDEFYKYPERYESNFHRFARTTDLLIACAYWDPRAPRLFEKKDTLRGDFAIKVIADVTCDIDGSVPTTVKASTIAVPVYDYNPADDRAEPPFSDEGNISVMAIDNLPCELPRDASESFGRELVNNVLPHLLGDDSLGVIRRATIAENGELTERFSYLQDYVAGEKHVPTT